MCKKLLEQIKSVKLSEQAKVWLVWIFPVLLIFAALGLWEAISADSMFFVTLLMVIILILALLTVGSLVYLCIKKKFGKAFMFLIFGIGPAALMFVISCFMLMFVNNPDEYGKQHPIPADFEYSLPLSSADSLAVDSADADTWLRVYNGFQGGIYTYDFYYDKPLAAGTVFLRCFEAVTNDPLTEQGEFIKRRVSWNTKQAVEAGKGFRKLVEGKRFTIYEGDWGDYYAVRVEAWHKAKDGGKETKLMEKVYRMEGWMR